MDSFFCVILTHFVKFISYLCKSWSAVGKQDGRLLSGLSKLHEFLACHINLCLFHSSCIILI